MVKSRFPDPVIRRHIKRTEKMKDKTCEPEWSPAIRHRACKFKTEMGIFMVLNLLTSMISSKLTELI